MNPRQLKKQAFWIALGAAVALLGALFALLIVPRQAEIKKSTAAIQSLTTQLMQASSDPVGHPDVAAWETYQKELAQKLADTVAFYRKTDERLEEWLPDFGIRSAETPDSGQFLAKYQDTEIALDNRLPWADETTQDDKGWRDVKARYFQELAEKRGAQAVAGAMRDMQKIHWIRSRFAKSLMPTIQAEAQLPTGQRSLRIRRIVFVRDVYDRWGAPSGVALRAGHMRGFPGVPERVEDFQLPGGLGSCITFCAEFTVSLAELPKILRDLLSYEPKEGERSMLVELLGVRAKPEDTAPFERSIDVPAHHTPEQKAQAAEDARASQRPLPVRVFLGARVFDFDGAKLGEIGSR
jgi:hypothetical protein